MPKSGESKQKSEQRREELMIFQAFMSACPDFADEKILEWRQSDCDPPDFICMTASGRRVGVEICQWAHEGEMKVGKLREVNEQRLLAAIGVPQPVNTSRNFWLAVFSPRAKVTIAPAEYMVFRQSLLRLISHADATWPTKPRGANYRFTELSRFPPLDKYIEQVQFVPGKTSGPDVDWIVPIGHCDSFDDRTMVDPLLNQLSKKTRKAHGPLKVGCDELFLLIAHDQALPYCSPISTPRRSVKKTVREATAAFEADRGPFTRAFLFLCGEPNSRVYRLLDTSE